MMKAAKIARSIMMLALAAVALSVAVMTGNVPEVTVGFVPETSVAVKRAAEKPTLILADGSTTTNALVTRVVDGDTIDVVQDGNEVRIRLLGVNTPETVDPRRPVECFGKEASSFAKTLLSDQRVRLEADPQADERDKYGRLLRNVILENGTDVNATLVASGYAQAYTSFPLTPQRKRQLTALEREAKAEGRGLWAEDACAK